MEMLPVVSQEVDFFTLETICPNTFVLKNIFMYH